MIKFIIYTDGGSRSNPGKAAAAYIIQDQWGEILFKEGKYLGIATNNEAEYQAINLALEKLVSGFIDQLPAEVEVRSDSQLIVSQLSGRFKIKNLNLKNLYKATKRIEETIGKITYTFIPRSQNFLADKLVNSILDQSSL